MEGDLSVAGALSAGESVGGLKVIGSLVMQTESAYRWELGVSGADLVEVIGDLTLADGWTLRLTDAGGTCGPSDQLDLFTYTDSLTLGTCTIDPSQVAALGRWDWSGAEVHHDQSRVYLTGLIVVPAPGTLMLLGMATLVLFAYAGRRRTRLGSPQTDVVEKV